MKKTNAFQFFNKNYSVKEYSDMYKKLRLDIRYPSNVKREQIFVKLLKKHKPKKIIDAVVNIKQGKQETLSIGNIFATRDWGYAKEYVEVMWKMLQQKKPEDYVISTGKSYSVKKFIEMVFKKFNIHIIWKINKKTGFANGYDKLKKKNIIKTDPYYFRPVELNSLKGDSKLAKKKLGWQPKCDLNQLIDIMLESEIKK